MVGQLEVFGEPEGGIVGKLWGLEFESQKPFMNLDVELKHFWSLPKQPYGSATNTC